MARLVVLAVLIGILILACSSADIPSSDPTPNVNATVEARVAQEPVATPAVDTPTPAPTSPLTLTEPPEQTLTPTPNARELEDRAAAKTREQADDWFDKGVSFYEKGLHEDAITSFDKAIAISPLEMYYQWRDMSLEKIASVKLTLLAVCHKILPNEIVPTETCLDRMAEGLNHHLSLFYGLEWKASPDGVMLNGSIPADAQLSFTAKGKAPSDLMDLLTEPIGTTENRIVTAKLRYPNPISGGSSSYYAYSNALTVTVKPETTLARIDVNPEDSPIFSFTPSPGFDWLTPSHPTDFIGLQTAVFGNKSTRSDTKETIGTAPGPALYLFDAKFSDDTTIEVRIDPAIETAEAQSEIAEKYLKMVGQLPGFLRRGIKTFSIFVTDDTLVPDRPAFAMGSHVVLYSHTFEQGSRESYVEELIFHEAVHATLDDFHKNNSQWLAAQQNDGQFISPYAKEVPLEDFAESYSMYYVSRITDPQLPRSIVTTILSTIPNRIQYFDAYAPLPESIAALPNGDLPDSNINCKGSKLEYESKGTIFLNDGDFQNAITQYTKAINLEPDSCDAYYLRGDAYHQQGMYDSAIRDHDMAIQLGSSDARVYRANSYFKKGESSFDLGLYEDSIENFNEAIESGPQANFYGWRGSSYYRLGQYENAIQDYTSAIQLEPTATRYRNRAISYRALGDYANADSDDANACSLDSQFC